MMCRVLALNTASTAAPSRGARRRRRRQRRRRFAARPPGGCARRARAAAPATSLGCQLQMRQVRARNARRAARCRCRSRARARLAAQLAAQHREDRPLVALAGFRRGQHGASLRQYPHASHRRAPDAPLRARAHRTGARPGRARADPRLRRTRPGSRAVAAVALRRRARRARARFGGLLAAHLQAHATRTSRPSRSSASGRRRSARR